MDNPNALDVIRRIGTMPCGASATDISPCDRMSQRLVACVHLRLIRLWLVSDIGDNALCQPPRMQRLIPFGEIAQGFVTPCVRADNIHWISASEVRCCRVGHSEL